MKKMLFMAFLLTLFFVGNVFAGAFDFASTTGEEFRNMAVLELFDTETVDSGATVYSNWVKIADCSKQNAMLWINGTCDSTATYAITFQVCPFKDSTYVADATTLSDTISSGTKTIKYLALTNYAFPWLRVKVNRTDTEVPSSTLDFYLGLKRDEVFSIPIAPATVAIQQKWRYDTDAD